MRSSSKRAGSGKRVVTGSTMRAGSTILAAHRHGGHVSVGIKACDFPVDVLEQRVVAVEVCQWNGPCNHLELVVPVVLAVAEAHLNRVR